MKRKFWRMRCWVSANTIGWCSPARMVSPHSLTTFLKDLKTSAPSGMSALPQSARARLQRSRHSHLRVDVMPSESLARNIAAAVNKYKTVENLKVLLLRAEVANPELPKSIRRAWRDRR